MNFNDTLKRLENLFASGLTVGGQNIKLVPQNFQGRIDDNEWVRINIFQSTSDLSYSGSQNIRGQLVCNIFVPVGRGLRRANEIADGINDLVYNKTISGVQTTNSFLTTVGVDSVDSGLFRIDYTINFNSYNNN